MAIRLFGYLGALAALIVAQVLGSDSVAAQEHPAAPPLVVTAFGGETPTTRYVHAPRTPWGDPDLQGVWSSDDTSGIPMQRPDQFGDRLYLTERSIRSEAKQVERGVDAGGESAVGLVPQRLRAARVSARRR